MPTTYEMYCLSDLFRKSRFVPHPDYILTQNYIQYRLDNLADINSEFNRRMHWIKRFISIPFLCKILNRLRYDALVGFVEEEGTRKIFGMISFQKHPNKHMVGMFDIYVSPERRHTTNVQKFANLVYDLAQRFSRQDYIYLQCGHNDTTRHLLTIFQKIAQRHHWDCRTDVEQSRIYLP